MSMTEQQAGMLARALGDQAEAWQSGGGIWIVSRTRSDGSMVVFSGDAVCEYPSEEAFDEGRAATTIELSAEDDLDADQEWVITDAAGTVYYRDDELKLGWSSQFEAERQARAWGSRGEGWFAVVENED